MSLEPFRTVYYLDRLWNFKKDHATTSGSTSTVACENLKISSCGGVPQVLDLGLTASAMHQVAPLPPRGPAVPCISCAAVHLDQPQAARNFFGGVRKHLGSGWAHNAKVLHHHTVPPKRLQHPLPNTRHQLRAGSFQKTIWREVHLSSKRSESPTHL